MDIKELYEKDYIDKKVEIQGWVKNHRKQAHFGFIDLYDGTTFKTLQVVYDDALENFEDITKIKIGSAVTVTGKLIKSPKEGQEFELTLESLTLEGDCPDDYPLQAKGRPTREFLREIAYLRPRTNLFQAVFRVRSVAAYAIHKYFQERGYVYVHTPLITANDGEGAGQMFQVTTLDLDKIASRNVRGLVRKINDYIDFLNNSPLYETKFYDIGDGISVTERSDFSGDNSKE